MHAQTTGHTDSAYLLKDMTAIVHVVTPHHIFMSHCHLFGVLYGTAGAGAAGGSVGFLRAAQCQMRGDAGSQGPTGGVWGGWQEHHHVQTARFRDKNKGSPGA